MNDKFIELALRFFFLFTPFFALSMFLAMTAEKSARDRRVLAHRTALSAQMIMTGVNGFLKN